VVARAIKEMRPIKDMQAGDGKVAWPAGDDLLKQEIQGVLSSLRP